MKQLTQLIHRAGFAGVAIFFALSHAGAVELHVAPNGRDSQNGTPSAPLATITAARDALRASGRLGKEPCAVVIGAGIYRLSAPVTFTPADSGSEKFPAIYRAAAGATVVLSGAQVISTPWEIWKDGIYRTQTGRRETIDQLFANGTRQVMARYPNLGAGFGSEKKEAKKEGGKGLKKGSKGGQERNVPYDGCAPDAWAANKVATWADPTGAFMHAMHRGLWGSQHYRVLGKKADGSLNYIGGWQNNRASGPHPSYRMIENVFEELDAPGEWYHEVKTGWLYYKPAPGVEMASAQFEAVFQLRHLLEFYGTPKTPVATLDIKNGGNGLPLTVVKTHETTAAVKNIRLEGLRFAGTARTFMETIEPLLRSDWTIYRGGAVHLRGTEGITIEGCRFEQLGGNAVFVDGYNRGAVIRSNRFRDNGASDVNLVGSPAAVRDPAFNVGAPARPLDQIDTHVGPKTEEYPADCLVEDNLMTRCGRFEKQVAGVNLSMSSRITVRHNTISHTPRAAINVCDGTWGGHVIEWNDCFETVLETQDHGAFNGWGRDRIWHHASPSGPNEKDKNGKPLISYYVEKYPESPRWDAYQPTIIRHNRMQCDHGWDIDLDDGCSNYEIYNNLCLSGGLKTREGYDRIVTNNIILEKGYTCNVPYPKPTHDVFERNILWGSRVYSASKPELWGGTRNYNFAHDPDAKGAVPAVALQQQTGDDANSLYGNAEFIAPQQGNFQVAATSPVLKLGFKNFPMTGFGVVSTDLKVAAPAPTIRLPADAAANTYKQAKTKSILGASFKKLDTDAEVTATGMFTKSGVLLTSVPKKSPLSLLGFEPDDVVLEMDGKKTNDERQFAALCEALKPGRHTVKVWRDQSAHEFTFSK